MPAFVGAVQVLEIGTSGVFNIGDVFQIKPYAKSKAFTGAGSFNTGKYLSIYNEYSTTNAFDNDFLDQGNYFNL